MAPRSSAKRAGHAGSYGTRRIGSLRFAAGGFVSVDQRHHVLQSRPRGSVIPASCASHVTLAERGIGDAPGEVGGRSRLGLEGRVCARRGRRCRSRRSPPRPRVTRRAQRLCRIQTRPDSRPGKRWPQWPWGQTAPSKEASHRAIRAGYSVPVLDPRYLCRNGPEPMTSMGNTIHNSPRISPLSSALEGASNYIARASCYGGRYGEGFSASGKTAQTALQSHAGGGNRTPDTRIVIPIVYRDNYLQGLRALSRNGNPRPTKRAGCPAVSPISPENRCQALTAGRGRAARGSRRASRR